MCDDGGMVCRAVPLHDDAAVARLSLEEQADRAAAVLTLAPSTAQGYIAAPQEAYFAPIDSSSSSSSSTD
jgi:hypothetical protein